MSVAGTLSVTGNTTISGNMNIPGILSVTGNTTVSGVLTSQNIVCGSNITPSFTANTLTVNMNNLSYAIFNISIGANIQTLGITNIIAGAQGIIYITASAGITISGSASTRLAASGGTQTLKIAYTSVALASANTAIMMITNDGTNNYINCNKFI
jgi:hypothetical protein